MSDAIAAAQAVPISREKAKLAKNRFHPAESRLVHWYIVPADGTPWETITQDDSYWAHIAPLLRPGHHIYADAEDGSYFAELKVRDAGRNWARVSVLRRHDLDPQEVTGERASDAYYVKYKGAILKHAVFRKKDETVVQSGFETREAAARWLAEHVKAVAA